MQFWLLIFLGCSGCCRWERERGLSVAHLVEIMGRSSCIGSVGAKEVTLGLIPAVFWTVATVQLPHLTFCAFNHLG